jgi:hypothetical protein
MGRFFPRFGITQVERVGFNAFSRPEAIASAN